MELKGRPEMMGYLASAEFQENLKQNEVILGVDEKTGNEFVVFGRSTLRTMLSAAAPRPTLTMRVNILQATDELVMLIAAVRVAKGYDEYEAYEAASGN